MCSVGSAVSEVSLRYSGGFVQLQKCRHGSGLEMWIQGSSVCLEEGKSREKGRWLRLNISELMTGPSQLEQSATFPFTCKSVLI